jgi:hypothetical protein
MDETTINPTGKRRLGAWDADVGPDGAVYIDQMDRPVSLLRFSASGGHAAEVARYPLQDYDCQFAILGDGRVVWKEQVSDALAVRLRR